MDCATRLTARRTSELTGGDVDEVMAWAEANAAGRTFVLYACVPYARLALVRLMGTDPKET